jgi:hypothetical protein
MGMGSVQTGSVPKEIEAATGEYQSPHLPSNIAQKQKTVR